MLILPKVRKVDGQVRMTSIDPHAIAGIEPEQIMLGKMKFRGTKIYTNTGEFFKCLCSPEFVTAGKALAAANPGKLFPMPVLNEATALGAKYDASVKQIQSAAKAMLALPSGQ